MGGGCVRACVPTQLDAVPAGRRRSFGQPFSGLAEGSCCSVQGGESQVVGGFCCRRRRSLDSRGHSSSSSRRLDCAHRIAPKILAQWHRARLFWAALSAAQGQPFLFAVPDGARAAQRRCQLRLRLLSCCRPGPARPTKAKTLKQSRAHECMTHARHNRQQHACRVASEKRGCARRAREKTPQTRVAPSLGFYLPRWRCQKLVRARCRQAARTR